MTGWRWLASSDACQEICLAIAARCPTVKLGQPFAIIGTNPKYKTIKFPPGHPHCACALEEILDTDPQPKWHDTLDQPKPATDEEADAVTARLLQQYEDIWNNKPPKPSGISKPKPLPKKPPRPAPLPTPELPVRNPMEPTPGEPIGDYLPTDEEIAKPPKKPKPPAAPKKPALPKFPDTGAQLDTVRTLGGSTGARLVRDPDSERLYVFKQGGNPGHLREENHADELYRAMGIDVPRSKLYERTTGPAKLSEFHEGKTLGELQLSDPAAYQAAVLELRKGFVADALLGNWDVIGMKADNILVLPNGKVLRIDNGGSLRYRAQGCSSRRLSSAMQWGNWSRSATRTSTGPRPRSSRESPTTRSRHKSSPWSNARQRHSRPLRLSYERSLASGLSG